MTLQSDFTQCEVTPVVLHGVVYPEPPSEDGLEWIVGDARRRATLFLGMLVYRGTSLIRNSTPLGPYGRPIPGALYRSQGVWRFLMSEVPLYLVIYDSG